MDDEREVLNGYVIDSYIWAGHKRICFGIAQDRNEEYPYMVCVYESEGYVFPVCDKMLCYDNFTEALTSYANKISERAKELDERRAALEVDDPACLKPEDVVVAPYETSIKGKVVAVYEHSISHGFRDIAHQLYYVNSGFGVEANSRGRACYGWNLYTGEQCRIERPHVMGIVPKEKLTAFAQKTLEKVKLEIKKEKDREER